MHMIEGRMYAMLDFTHLPMALWGEAALTAAYLFNHTELCALPTGKTPYEMLHGLQPNLAHLHVFGAQCFARIPPELQHKLGLKSHEAIFLGYPPGVKAWRCCDTVSGAFFNSQDVIFDESFSNCPSPNSDDNDDHPLKPVAAAPPAPSIPEPRHLAIICWSGRIPLVTEKGQLYKECLATDKARLSHQRVVRSARINGIPPLPADNKVFDPPIVTLPTPMPTPPPPEVPDPDAIIEDDEEVGFPHVIANLIVVKVAALLVRSDTRHNPLASRYDLHIPPATYDEAT
jgi:hypothetical protein